MLCERWDTADSRLIHDAAQGRHPVFLQVSFTMFSTLPDAL